MGIGESDRVGGFIGRDFGLVEAGVGGSAFGAVSYTHLTLPTTYSV